MLLFVSLLLLTLGTLAGVATMGHLATDPDRRRPLARWGAGDVLANVSRGSSVLSEGRKSVLDELTRTSLRGRAH
jgi:hypothetical protein